MATDRLRSAANAGSAAQVRPGGAVWVAALLLALLGGCAGSAQEHRYGSEETVDGADTAFGMPGADIVSADSIPVRDYAAEIELMLMRATEACRDSAFDSASQLLRAAVGLVDSLAAAPEQEGEESRPADYYPEIVGLYTQMMPPNYVDSIPEHIAFLAFQRQISVPLDSIELSDQDSTLLANLNCQKGVPYNLPITWNERVVKAVYLLVSRRKEGVERWLARAEHYLPPMKALLSDSGLPTDLVYLPLIESGFNPRAYSYAHAAGIWQFIPTTGRRYGLRSGYWLDERRDPMKSTSAAVAYLKKLYRDFGDWYLALAAYNCGENGVARAMARAMAKADTSDYWVLALPKQTMDYVPHFLAALMVAKNPHCFGYRVTPADTFSLDTVTVDDCLDLNVIADGIGIPFAELKEINPHILRWCTPPSETGVTLYLPKGKREPYVEFHSALTDEDKVRWYRYRIRPGDNLGSIAGRFRLTVQALQSVNELSSTRIIAGTYLHVPIPVNEGYPPESRPADAQLSSTARPRQAPAAPTEKGELTRYRVKAGDTMSELAELFGVAVSDICRWNDISRARHLRAGQIIKLYINQGSAPASGGGSTRATGPTQQKVGGSGTPRTYTVKKGDNLYSIAGRLGTTLSDLVAWNGKNPDHPIIHPGERLAYYSGGAGTGTRLSPESGPRTDCIKYRVAPGDNLSNLARLFTVPLNGILELNNFGTDHVLHEGDIVLIPRSGAGGKGDQSTKRVVYYHVQKGDNLWSISRLFKVSLDGLRSANGLSVESVLKPGDTLRVFLAEGQ